MVSCLHDSITEEVKVEQEEEGQENLKNQSLSEPKTPFVLIDQLDLCPPGLEDLSLSFADSFLDFDSIMADLGENPVGFCSKDSEFGIVEKSLEVSNDELCEETLVIEDLNRDGFCGKVGEGPDKEEGEIWAFKKGIDGFCETNKVEEELNRDGGKLADFGCLIEEEMGKVILDGSDGSTSLGINVNDIASGVKVVGGMSAEKSGWIDDCNSVDLESTELANSKDNRAPKCEDVSLREDKLKSGNILINNENQMLIGGSDNDDNETESESESESKSSSSSSSSSSSDEEDEDEDDEQSKEGEEESGDEKKSDNEDGVAVGKLVIEEGEIMLSDAEEMVGWSDDEDGGRGMAGPIRSKNELKFLPPVPSVDVTLEPHHQIQPVGIVSSIIDAQVIVEGVENHNPLNEGSVCWITESRSALGIVDEVFGPVKNPYYIVRYNSETDVPVNIQQGTLVSFVPEFANHVLHDKNIYQKGYDASNENDEEMSDDLEFSDDEKEAEYKRMLKMKKRGKNEPKLGQKKDKKQFKNRSGNWNYDRDATGKASAQDNKLQIDRDQHLVNPQVGASRDQISGLVGELAMIPPFAPRVQAPGFCPPNGNWANGFLCQQPQSMAIPSGFPGNGIPWLPQTHPQQLNQMPLPNGLPLQHQHNAIPGLPFNFVLPGGQANYGGGPTFSPWIGQNVFNQSPFGMGLPGQQTSLPVNVEGQAIQPNGSQFGYDPNLQPSPVTSGRPHDRGIGGGGRNMHQNRGAHFGRGRGRHRGR